MRKTFEQKLDEVTEDVILMGSLVQDTVNDAINSLKKFKDYDIVNMIIYHGGLFNDKPNEGIKEVIRYRKFFSYKRNI